MRDLIDRQELIYSLEYLPFYHEFWKNEGYEGLWKSEDVINRIKNMPSAQQWTPVSEGLPKLKDGHYVSGWVLCSDNEERVCFGRVEENVFGQMLWNCERDGVSGKVVAWMPLPEPFKGGDAE